MVEGQEKASKKWLDFLPRDFDARDAPNQALCLVFATLTNQFRCFEEYFGLIRLIERPLEKEWLKRLKCCASTAFSWVAEVVSY